MEADRLTQQLVTPKGFVKRFFDHLKDDVTQVDAYERTEQEYEGLFGQRKYSGYNSFRQIKNRMIKEN